MTPAGPDPFDPALPHGPLREKAVQLYRRLVRQNPNADPEVVAAVLSNWLRTDDQLRQVAALIDRLDRMAANLAKDSKALAANQKKYTDMLLSVALGGNRN